MPLLQVRAAAAGCVGGVFLQELWAGTAAGFLSFVLKSNAPQPPQAGFLVAETFTPSGARPWDLFEKSSLGWLCLPLPREPPACWTEALDAGPGKAKHNLRTGLEPSSPIMLWQAGYEAAELSPAPSSLQQPHKSPAPQCVPGGHGAHACVSPGGSSALQRPGQSVLGGRAGCVWLLQALYASHGIWLSRCRGQDIAAGISEPLRRPVPALWMCNAHRHGVQCVAVGAVFI